MAGSAHPPSPMRVRLDPRGLDLGKGSILPLYAGAMHYWRHVPSAEWAAGLRRHQVARPAARRHLRPVGGPRGGEGAVLTSGRRDAQPRRRAVPRAGAEGGAQGRPPSGPAHQRRSSTLFEIPERVVWDKACQALTPQGNLVMLPIPPLAFPGPEATASDTFHDETARWFQALGKVISRFRYPEVGPSSSSRWTTRERSTSETARTTRTTTPTRFACGATSSARSTAASHELAAAWSDPTGVLPRGERAAEVRREGGSRPRAAPRLDGVPRAPPGSRDGSVRPWPPRRRFRWHPDDAQLPDGRVGHAAQRRAHGRRRRSLRARLLPPGEPHRAPHRLFVARRSLVSRCEGTRTPKRTEPRSAPGFPPFFAPIDPGDSIYTLLVALAYGLRAFNLYMAVERDRWIGAPIDLLQRQEEWGPFAARATRRPS